MYTKIFKLASAGLILAVTVLFAARNNNIKTTEFITIKNYSHRINELFHAAKDTNVVNRLYELAKKFQKTDLEKCYTYCDSALAVAQAIHWKKGEAKAVCAKGVACVNFLKYEDAIIFLREALKIAEEINDKSLIITITDYLGYSLASINNFTEALEQFGKKMAIDDELGDKKGLAYDLQRIGRINADNLSNYTKAKECFEKALILDEEPGDQKEIEYDLSLLGQLYIKLPDYPKALEYFEKALNISRKINDTVTIIRNNGNMGIAYSYMADYPKALNCEMQALKLSEETGNKKSAMFNVMNIGNIYTDLSNNEKALEYGMKGLALAEELGDKNNMSLILNNIGTTHFNMQEYPQALEYYEKALKISEELQDKYTLCMLTEDIGNIYGTYFHDYPKALEYYSRAKTIAEETGDIRNKAHITFNISANYCKMALDSTKKDTSGRKGNFLKGLTYIKESLEIYKQIGEKHEQAYSLLHMSDIFFNLGDYQSALSIYKEFINLKDSIYSGDDQKKIAELEAKRENELKQKEIEILQQKNQIQNLDLTRQQQAMALLHGKQKLQSLELEKKSNDMALMQKEKDVTSLELKQKNLEAEKKDKEVTLLNKEKAYQSMLSRSLTGGLFFTGAIILLLFLFFRRKRRDNKKLEEKNLIIEQSNTELSQMNQNLTAKNIQISQQKDQIISSHEIIQAGIDQAKDYVLSLLPQKINTGPVQTDWLFLPSNQLGGDAFGYHRIDNNH
ncbi:MAG: tetratricopeptide repeat protein, partial [Bacteroidia bacterium]|nr:tetratricopeptide repeat protein [Bacteroidia bacterium]